MFVHVDMDYFFAQVEERRHPMSKGKIIIVCVYSGRTADSGVVSTVNYAGRRLGIRSGIPIIQAKRLAPPSDSIFLPVDKEYYAQVSAHIDSIIRPFCMKTVQASIDEWNCEVPDSNAASIARDVKDAIRREAGLACSVGVAPSLLGAKMAASKSKPDGFLPLDAKAEKELIGGSDIEKVPGIGGKTAEGLHALGVVRVKDLAKITPIALVEAFGRKGGSWLHALGQGEYGDVLGEEKEQVEVSRIGTLKEKTRDPYMILEKLDELEAEAKEWLMKMKKSYKTLGVIFVMDDMKTHTKSLSFRNPKNWDEDVSKEIKSLISEFLAENRNEVRRIGIRFGNFMDLGGQTTLF
jgi:DNA polymerase IV (DinB-like DNA polymerase)